MRRSALIGILLTLLSALLVLGAAFVFLFQGRQQLEERAENLEASQRSLNQAVTEAQDSLATRDASLVALDATRVALVEQLNGNETTLGQLQQENQDLSAAVIERDAIISQLQTQAISGENQPPLVVIFSPENGQTIRPDQPIAIVVSASDPAGVLSLDVRVDDTLVYTQDVGGRALFTANLLWTPTISDGVQTISAVATNIAEVSSPPTAITVTVADLAARNQERLTEVQTSVAAIRGLSPRLPIQLNLVPSDQWPQQLAAAAGDTLDPEAAERQVLILSAFNFFPAGYPLYQTNLALSAEQPAGYYDPQTNQLILADQNGLLSAADQWLYAGEYVHALQDQYYRLDDLANPALDSEARLALQALAEGDARLVQLNYRQADYFDSQELAEIADFVSQPESTALTGAPRILQATRAMIEDGGLLFVQELYDESGWASVNNAWINPPVTTEQILHPDKYLAGELPQPLTLPLLTATLGPGWQRLVEEPFGEFYLREYLAQQISQQEAELAAAGWGGGRYAVYHHPEDDALVMVLSLVWDASNDDDQFRDAFTLYATNLAGNPGLGQPDGGRCWQMADILCLYHLNEANFIIRAPTLETALAIATAMQATVQAMLPKGFTS
jgi:hypothetical protein